MQFFKNINLFIYFNWRLITSQYCIGSAIHQHESARGIHVFPILNPTPSSLPILSLWVISVHQPQASSILHWTWTGSLFHIWYYTCFNAILPNHPTLSLSHRVQKTVLYICVSCCFAYRVIITIFLNSIYMRYYTVLVEKEMATHSSVLAWRIPGMAQPSGLPSMG